MTPDKSNNTAPKDPSEDELELGESSSGASADSEAGEPPNRHSRLPSSDDFAALGDAGDDLDDAFDSISSPGLTIPKEEPTVSFGGSPAGSKTNLAGKTAVAAADDEAFYDEDDADFDDDEWVAEVEVDADFNTLTPVSFGDSLAEIWEGCGPLDGVPKVAQRIHMCQATAQVHQLFSSSDESHAATAAVLERAKKLEQELEGIKLKSKAGRVLAKTILDLLAPLEEKQAEFDKKIPMSWLRGAYLKLDLEMSVCVGYFNAHIHRSDLSAAWWERVVILAVGSASSADKMGTLTTLPVTYVSALWDEVLPKSRLDLESIEASVRFFHDAAGQLPELEDPRDLFQTDFYIDVIGYQVTLREALFRPEILYACVEFHVNLSNWIEGDSSTRVLQSTLNEDIAAAYKKVRSIFKTQFEDQHALDEMRARLRGQDAQRKRAEERRARAGRYGKKAAKERAEKQAKRRRQIFYAIGAVIILLVGLPVFRGLVGERSRDLKTMAATDMLAIHPMLVSASMSKEAGLLVGKIDSDQWALLNKEQRTAVANKLVSVANMRALRSLMVYSGEALVIDVSGGALRYVE